MKVQHVKRFDADRLGLLCRLHRAASPLLSVEDDRLQCWRNHGGGDSSTPPPVQIDSSSSSAQVDTSSGTSRALPSSTARRELAALSRRLFSQDAAVETNPFALKLAPRAPRIRAKDAAGAVLLQSSKAVSLPTTSPSLLLSTSSSSSDSGEPSCGSPTSAVRWQPEELPNGLFALGDLLSSQNNHGKEDLRDTTTARPTISHRGDCRRSPSFVAAPSVWRILGVVLMVATLLVLLLPALATVPLWMEVGRDWKERAACQWKEPLEMVLMFPKRSSGASLPDTALWTTTTTTLFDDWLSFADSNRGIGSNKNDSIAAVSMDVVIPLVDNTLMQAAEVDVSAKRAKELLTQQRVSTVVASSVAMVWWSQQQPDDEYSALLEADMAKAIPSVPKGRKRIRGRFKPLGKLWGWISSKWRVRILRRRRRGSL